MMKIQLLSLNLRRLTALRGFSSAPIVTRKSDVDSKDGEASTIQKDLSSKFSVKSLESTKPDDEKNEIKKQKPIERKENNKGKKGLKTDNETTTVNGNNDSKLTKLIDNSSKVTELLSISEKNFNQKTAIHILSRISLLSATNKVKSEDFENDYRFLKICRLLAKVPIPSEQKKHLPLKSVTKSAELETVLSVACDDEAIQLIESLPVSQQVRVLSSLARKKTRSPIVLKSLAESIHRCEDSLNLKECSDILYALFSLNYNNEMLLKRISSEICQNIDKNKDKIAVVGSIVTSLGYLKYKSETLLDKLSEWIVQQNELCRPKDLASFILTLALCNHRPSNLNDLASKILPKLTEKNVSASEWLDFVWALSVLELQQVQHLESVLRPEFAETLSAKRELSAAQKMKILNLNGVAKYLTTDYSGPTIQSDSNINQVSLGYRRSKQILVDGLLDTLKSLFTNQSYVRIGNDTHMGFVIDAECVLNEKRLPLAIDSDSKDAFRIAFMVMDFHDLCKGDAKDPSGFNELAIKLLKKAGYTVLVMPHTEFSTSDKLLKRVQYLDTKLKEIVNSK